MNALKSAFFGLLLVAASVILLFWAEGRAVNTAKALEEGSGIVVEADAATIDPANEGKLLHISGDAVPQDVPADTRLGLSAEGAVSLTRKVEMLQWKETSREVERTGTDGKTTKTKVYDYEKVWSASPIDSTTFKTASAPKNPAMPLSGDSFEIAAAKVGAFVIAGNAIAPLGQEKPVALTDSGIEMAAGALGGARPMWLVNNQYLSADDPDSPQVGDIRISFQRGDVSRVSIVGKQGNGKLMPYTTSNGREVFLIQAGSATAAEMFKDAIAGNKMLTWIIRIGGLVLMFIGFAMTFSPLTATLGRVPLIGGLVRGGAALVGIVLTLMLGSLVIAAGWVFYRPLLALLIVAIGVGLAVAVGMMGKKKQAAITKSPA
ncbi:TMEM43 family protein [Aestuariivirga sp.]|uniref:TMEM43 family protein n=1 Tax=Aestuariivirga sp. TaxID=2650926 RepID=UPI003594677A